MALIAGTRLGPYDITAQIGEGGMGQVWRATDTSLGRQVAIKILPEAFAADPDRLARFEREAKKVLDFGLAKAMEPADGSRQPADAWNKSPTVTTPAMTAAGISLGTAAYMAPEQARGKAVDKRADLWAFGAVLFEMLSGTRAFEGEDITDTLGNVLKMEPDWSRVPDTVPARVRGVLRACLQKNLRQRLDSAQGVRLALEGAFETPAAPTGANVTEAPSWWRRAVRPVTTAAALLVAAAAWLGRPSPAPAGRLTLTIVPPPGVTMAPVATLFSPPQVAPDGSAVLFSGAEGTYARGLYVRRLDTLDVLRVPGSEGLANEAFWHGSTRVTFPFTTGATRRVARHPAARRRADVAHEVFRERPRWKLERQRRRRPGDP